MPDRRETMGGYTAHQKIEYPDNGYFTIPDYRPETSLHIHDYGDADYATIKAGQASCVEDSCPDKEGNDVIKIPAEYQVCGTCHGRGSHVNPSIDSHGITASEMDELGDDFRENYFSGVYDVNCSECEGKRVVLEPCREILTDEQMAALTAWETAIAEEGQEIYLRNKGYQF